MIHATLGFIYTSDLNYVLLIEKQKPISHKGKLNGLGGKNEEGEDGKSCIAREVKEESGLEISSDDWQLVGNLSWEDWDVEIFASIYKGNKEDVVPEKDKKIDWYPTKKLPDNVIENLLWLIPLGIDCLLNTNPPIVKVTYF
jgi:8-oxo-dGTP pyrophosphatase MutT (NUDIX family)